MHTNLICSVFIIIFYANSFASSLGSERDDRASISAHITLPTATTLREEVLEKSFKDCLVKIKHLVGSHPIQHCFLSYVNEDPDMLWMHRIESYLREVGVQPTYDMRTLGVGDSIIDFIQKVREAHYAIVLFSPRYLINFDRGTYIRTEANEILNKWKDVEGFVIPLLLAERPNGSIPSLMNRRPKDLSTAVETIIEDSSTQQSEGLDILYIALAEGRGHADFEESLECVFRMLKERIYKSIIGVDAPFERNFDRIKRGFDDRKLKIPERALHTILKATHGAFPQSLKTYNAFFDRTNEFGQSYVDTIFEKLFMEHMDERQFATLTICAVSGMGGVGKTTLATEFAHKYKQFYQFIYWMDGSSKREFLSSCVILLESFSVLVPEQRETEEDDYFSTIIGMMNEFLPKHKKNWLLIVDNIEESKFVTELEPAGGHVLYISRNIDWLKRLEINVFKPEESVAYLLQITGFDESHRDEAMALAIELDHLPLALAQAAAYISRQGLSSFAEYLMHYKVNQAYLLAQKQIQPSVNGKYGREAIVMTTWNTTMQKLSQQSQSLVSLCSYLAPTDIPVALFHHNDNQESLEKTIKELSSYSMLKSHDNYFSIHRLVQFVSRPVIPEQSTLMLEHLTNLFFDFWEIINTSFANNVFVDFVEMYQNLSLLLAHNNNVCSYLSSVNTNELIRTESYTSYINLNILNEKIIKLLRNISSSINQIQSTSTEEEVDKLKVMKDQQAEINNTYFKRLLSINEELNKGSVSSFALDYSSQEFEFVDQKIFDERQVNIFEEESVFLREVYLMNKMKSHGLYDATQKKIKKLFLDMKAGYVSGVTINSEIIKTQKWKKAIKKLRPFLKESMSCFDQLWLISIVADLDEMLCDETLEKAKILITQEMDAFDQSFIIKASKEYLLEDWLCSIEKLNSVIDPNINALSFVRLIDTALKIEKDLWIASFCYIDLLGIKIYDGNISSVIYILDLVHSMGLDLRNINSSDIGLIHKINLFILLRDDNKNFNQKREAFINGCRNLAMGSNIYAQILLGVAYNNGFGVYKNEVEALKWFLLAAEQGNSEAQFYYGSMLFNSKDRTKDIQEAIRWLLLAAREDVKAQSVLGLIYFGILKDINEAIKWYNLAAEEGHAEAQYQLGMIYKRGQDLTIRDEAKAEKWLKFAANQGHANAQFELGAMFANNHFIINDNTQAIKWFRLAAEQEHKKAQVFLTGMYACGKGVTQNKKHVVKLLQHSLKQGRATEQYVLGVKYIDGDGVTKNVEEGLKLIHQAAEKGHVFACYELGLIYENGLGVSKDETEAERWFSLATDQGHGLSQAFLDEINKGRVEMRKGRVDRNRKEEHEKWVSLFETEFQDFGGISGAMGHAHEQEHAAILGDEKAQYQLGLTYSRGRGVTKDEVEAVN